MPTYVEYSANTSKYESAMAQMEAVSSKTLDFVKNNWLGLGTAIGLAYKVMGNFNEALDTADQLNKLSKSTGIATEELSAYKYAAELSGISIEETARGINKLSVNMAEAAGGSKEAQKGFELLGIAVRDSGGQLRSTDEVMKEIADKFSRMPDGTTKAALAMEFFGRSGTALIPMLDDGADGLSKMRTEAERLGLIVSGDTARAAEQFNDNLAKLNKLAQGAANVLMGAYLPALDAVVQKLLEMTGITGNLAEKHLKEQREGFLRDIAEYRRVIEGEQNRTGDELSWMMAGGGNAEEAQKQITILESRIRLIDKTLGNMRAEAEAMANPKTPLGVAIPDNWGKAPKEDKELQRMQERADLEMAKAQETLTMKSDMEKFMEKDLDEYLYNMRQARLEQETGFAQKRIELRQWEHDAALQIAQTQSEEEDRLARRREEMIGKTTTAMLENWMYFFQYFGKQNKAAFTAFKAVAIAQTVIDTYKAAQGAYSAMASIPYVGPILGAVAAAAAIAAGMARVSAISSTEPGSAGGGGGGGGGAVGVYSASPMTGVPTGIPAGVEGESKPAVTIYIQGDSINDEEYLERWAEKISKMVEDRDVRLVSSNSKYADQLA